MENIMNVVHSEFVSGVATLLVMCNSGLPYATYVVTYDVHGVLDVSTNEETPMSVTGVLALEIQAAAAVYLAKKVLSS